jgi:hypothetical protein
MTGRPGRIPSTIQLLLGTAAAALVGLLIYAVYPFSPEERAISELRRAIPKVRLVWDDKGELGIVFLQTGVKDQDLGYLRGLPVKWLTFIKEPLTDKGFESLSGFADLSALTLMAVPISDDGLRFISRFTALKLLAVEMTDITDDGIASLATLSQLQELNLSDTRVTGRGLEHLVALTKIQRVEFVNTPLTDDGLRFIGKMTSLRELGLDGTQITDAGLEHLYGLTTLERLAIFRTAVTQRGLTRLRSHLPSLVVFSELNWKLRQGSEGSGEGRKADSVK